MSSTHKFAIMDGATVTITTTGGKIVESFEIDTEAFILNEFTRHGWRIITTDWGEREFRGKMLPFCSVVKV